MTGGDGTAYMGEATMTSAQKRKDTMLKKKYDDTDICLLYTSPSPRDRG